MKADFKLGNDYKIKPNKGVSILKKKFPDVVNEHLDEYFSVNTIDWTPKETQSHTLEGEPTCSVSLVLEGEGIFSVNNGPSFPIKKSSVYIFRTNQITTGTNQFKAGKRYLLIDFRYPPLLFSAYEKSLMELNSNKLLTSFVLFTRQQMSNNLLRVAHEVLACQMKGLARELYLRSKALEVLAYITNETENFPLFLLRDQLSIKQARQVLEKRYAEPWTIKRLSREVGINECKLKQGFRELLKTTVHSCLTDIRISQACKLLRSSTESVTAVGLQTGYTNPSHFTRVFRQKIGKTPRQWRQYDLIS